MAENIDKIIAGARQKTERILKKDFSAFDYLNNSDKETLVEELKKQRVYSELLELELSDLNDKLEQSEKNYMEFYDMPPVGFLTISPEGMVEEINIAMTNLLKISKRDILMQNLCKYICQADHNRFCDFIHNSVNYENVSFIEAEFSNSDGKSINCRVKAKYSKERDNCIIMSVHDITDHIEYEKQLEKTLIQLGEANETINKKHYELQEMNYKLEKIRNELSFSINEKDNFLKSVYKDLTLVFSKFLILSEEISKDELNFDTGISDLSNDLYSSVKATIQVMDKYYKL
jgi:PAS domain S-box-containing protein